MVCWRCCGWCGVTRGADPNHQQFFVLNLFRYDLGKIYTVNSYDRVRLWGSLTGPHFAAQNYCNASSVSGNMPSLWSWVAGAQYGGEFRLHGGLVLQTWNTTVGGVTLVVGVSSPNYNTRAWPGMLLCNAHCLQPSSSTA